MNVLFDTGYRLGTSGYRWFKSPPGLDASADAEGPSIPLRKRLAD
jgi:hypothetical protein